jgi:hypothetical protein
VTKSKEDEMGRAISTYVKIKNAMSTEKLKISKNLKIIHHMADQNEEGKTSQYSKAS